MGILNGKSIQAESVIDIFENKYPGDKRPRKAIKSIRTYLNNPSKKTKSNAGDAAAYAAGSADAAAYKRIINYGIKLIQGGKSWT